MELFDRSCPRCELLPKVKPEHPAGIPSGAVRVQPQPEPENTWKPHSRRCDPRPHLEVGRECHTPTGARCCGTCDWVRLPCGPGGPLLCAWHSQPCPLWLIALTVDTPTSCEVAATDGTDCPCWAPKKGADRAVGWCWPYWERRCEA